MEVGIIGTRGVLARYGEFETCAEELSEELVKKVIKFYILAKFYNK